ncbi:MAG: SDR family oxidoreductase [Nitrososphaerota archaeon]
MKEEKILVTGGAGFIGSHLVDELINRGYEVIVLDNFYSGKIGNLRKNLKNKNFKLIKGDVRNIKDVKKAIKNVNAIFHLAAIVSVPLSIKNPILVNEVNVIGSLNVLKIAIEENVDKFIYVSSCAVYGEAENLPIKEEDKLNPLSPYASSKISVEYYCKVFYKAYGLKTICLRYFNVYGPRQKTGEYAGVIPIFIQRIKNDKPPIIYGDGKQTRDFVYVKDVVDASIKALEKEEAIGEIFNIGSGEAITINQLAETLLKILGKEKLKPIYEKERVGDIKNSYANIDKAKKILGYEPKYTIIDGLKEMLKK